MNAGLLALRSLKLYVQIKAQGVRCVVGSVMCYCALQNCVGLRLSAFVFLTYFPKLRKANVSFIMPVCPRGTTRLPLDRFSWSFIFEDFSTVCRENSSFISTLQKYRVLYIKTSIHLARFFLEWEIKGKGAAQKPRCGPQGFRRFRLPDFHDIWHMKVVRLSASRPDRL
jgi:hypothetical protein